MRRLPAVVAWLPFVALCAAISTVSHLSEPPLQQLLALRLMDKVLHACAYVGVGATAYLGVARHLAGGRAAFFAAVALATAHGALDEVHQSFVPKRFASVADVLADFTGALVGVWLCGLVLRRAFDRPRASDPGAPARGG